ncbi:MAG: hypothetical protein ABEK17_01280 [Candidatus Aenigmatarchaeota archaeon]
MPENDVSEEGSLFEIYGGDNKKDNNYFDCKVGAGKTNPPLTGLLSYGKGIIDQLWYLKHDQESGDLVNKEIDYFTNRHTYEKRRDMTLEEIEAEEGGETGEEPEIDHELGEDEYEITGREEAEEAPGEIEELRNEIDTIINTIEDYGDEIVNLTEYSEEEFDRIHEGFDQLRDEMGRYGERLEDHGGLNEEEFYQDLGERIDYLENELRDMGEETSGLGELYESIIGISEFDRYKDMGPDKLKKMMPLIKKSNIADFVKVTQFLTAYTLDKDVSEEQASVIKYLNNFTGKAIGELPKLDKNYQNQ